MYQRILQLSLLVPLSLMQSEKPYFIFTSSFFHGEGGYMVESLMLKKSLSYLAAN